MLLLTRRLNESIVIGDAIRIKVIKVERGQVQLGITAPRDVPVHREEVYDLILAENKASAQAHPSDLDKLLNPLLPPSSSGPSSKPS